MPPRKGSFRRPQSRASGFGQLDTTPTQPERRAPERQPFNAALSKTRANIGKLSDHMASGAAGEPMDKFDDALDDGDYDAIHDSISGMANGPGSGHDGNLHTNAKTPGDVPWNFDCGSSVPPTSSRNSNSGILPDTAPLPQSSLDAAVQELTSRDLDFDETATSTHHSSPFGESRINGQIPWRFDTHGRSAVHMADNSSPSPLAESPVHESPKILRSRILADKADELTTQPEPSMKQRSEAKTSPNKSATPKVPAVNIDQRPSKRLRSSQGSGEDSAEIEASATNTAGRVPEPDCYELDTPDATSPDMPQKQSTGGVQSAVPSTVKSSKPDEILALAPSKKRKQCAKPAARFDSATQEVQAVSVLKPVGKPTLCKKKEPIVAERSSQGMLSAAVSRKRKSAPAQPRAQKKTKAAASNKVAKATVAKTTKSTGKGPVLDDEVQSDAFMENDDSLQGTKVMPTPKPVTRRRQQARAAVKPPVIDLPSEFSEDVDDKIDEGVILTANRTYEEPEYNNDIVRESLEVQASPCIERSNVGDVHEDSGEEAQTSRSVALQAKTATQKAAHGSVGLPSIIQETQVQIPSGKIDGVEAGKPSPICERTHTAARSEGPGANMDLIEVSVQDELGSPRVASPDLCVDEKDPEESGSTTPSSYENPQTPSGRSIAEDNSPPGPLLPRRKRQRKCWEAAEAMKQARPRRSMTSELGSPRLVNDPNPDDEAGMENYEAASYPAHRSSPMERLKKAGNPPPPVFELDVAKIRVEKKQLRMQALQALEGAAAFVFFCALG